MNGMDGTGEECQYSLLVLFCAKHAPAFDLAFCKHTHTHTHTLTKENKKE